MKNTHYSYGLDMIRLPKIMERFAKKIATIVERTERTPILIYSGMSGVSHATALGIKLAEIGVKHNMIYVRKEHERSHGGIVEHNLGESRFSAAASTYLPAAYCLIFVDDVIDSGATRRMCVEKFRLAFKPSKPIPMHYCLAGTDGGRSLRAQPTMIPP